MRVQNRSDFKMRRSFRLIGVDVFFAFASMMLVIRWRYDFTNEPILSNIDHKAALIAAAATLITWVLLRQDRAIWRFTTLDDFKKISVGISLCGDVFWFNPCFSFIGDAFAKWGFPRLIPFAFDLWAGCLAGWPSRHPAFTKVGPSGLFRFLAGQIIYVKSISKQRDDRISRCRSFRLIQCRIGG